MYQSQTANTLFAQRFVANDSAVKHLLGWRDVVSRLLDELGQLYQALNAAVGLVALDDELFQDLQIAGFLGSKRIPFQETDDFGNTDVIGNVPGCNGSSGKSAVPVIYPATAQRVSHPNQESDIVISKRDFDRRFKRFGIASYTCGNKKTAFSVDQAGDIATSAIAYVGCLAGYICHAFDIALQVENWILISMYSDVEEYPGLDSLEASHSNHGVGVNSQYSGGLVLGNPAIPGLGSPISDFQNIRLAEEVARATGWGMAPSGPNNVVTRQSPGGVRAYSENGVYIRSSNAIREVIRGLYGLFHGGNIRLLMPTVKRAFHVDFDIRRLGSIVRGNTMFKLLQPRNCILIRSLHND